MYPVLRQQPAGPGPGHVRPRLGSGGEKGRVVPARAGSGPSEAARRREQGAIVARASTEPVVALRLQVVPTKKNPALKCWVKNPVTGFREDPGINWYLEANA